MADHATDHEIMSDSMDAAQHDATWGVFTNLIKWGIIVLAVLVLALYVVINP